MENVLRLQSGACYEESRKYLDILRDFRSMKFWTIIETLEFSKQAAKIWSEDELDHFKVFLATNPKHGQVIPRTGGYRKIRWSLKDSGKRGGVRVIYFNYTKEKCIELLAIYNKSNVSSISNKTIRNLD